MSRRALAVALCLAVAAAATGASAKEPTAARRTFAHATPGPAPICGARQLANRAAPIYHRPPGIPLGRPLPLVLALHGDGGTGQNMEGLSHFEELADVKGFVVVLPTACNIEHAWHSPQDRAYLRSLIRSLRSGRSGAGAVDRSRVYVTGFSSGGAASWRLGCEHSHEITAIAVVSEVMDGHVYDTCRPARPVAEMLMIGTADTNRWRGIRGQQPGAAQTTRLWTTLDRCERGRARVHRVTRSIVRTIWRACAGGSGVGLYVLYGADHVWPPYGLGAPAHYSASRAVWSFLSSFRRSP